MRRDARSSAPRCFVANHRATFASCAFKAQRWSAPRSTARRADRHPVCPAHGDPLGDATGGDGVWLRRDLLATTAGLAGSGRMGPTASRVAAAAAGCGPDRQEPRMHGQFVHRPNLPIQRRRLRANWRRPVDGRARLKAAVHSPSCPHPGIERRQLPPQAEQATSAQRPSPKLTGRPSRRMTDTQQGAPYRAPCCHNP
jgi:hypothetical protein